MSEQGNTEQASSKFERLNAAKVRFVRHAESMWNARFTDAEAADVVLKSSHDGAFPLTAKGRDQAHSLKERLGPTDCIIVSSYMRTGQTSEHITVQNDINVVHRWNEIREFFPFSWEIVRGNFAAERQVPRGEHADFMAPYFERMDIDEKTPHDPNLPPHMNEQESFKEYFSRVHGFILKLGAFLLENPETKSPVIFSHGFFIRQLHSQLTKYSDVFKLPDGPERDAQIRESMRGFEDICMGRSAYDVPNVAIKEDLDPLLKAYWQKYRKEIENFNLN